MTTLPQLQVAFATTDGITVDGHFGSCEQFYIYRIDSEEYERIDVRKAEAGRGTDKNEFRAELINDCQLMFCASIGGPAAARVIRNNIHPMKCKPVGETFPTMTEQLELLKERMQSKQLPPWLAKLTGQPDQLSGRFETL
ncbi:NifB/NifX family molybdenum-iron cluster-binding protein [Psychromonas sp. PT13]|uniref:NifB/NifX family molybdenum-iron cluster-binding protein n=1 Tax=Psychromonas sp. PT13 TaxID=3439547 RepID=UPI003EBBC09C